MGQKGKWHRIIFSIGLLRQYLISILKMMKSTNWPLFAKNIWKKSERNNIIVRKLSQVIINLCE